MKTRPRITRAAAAVLLAAVCVYAAARPNFTGTWELDQTRSHSLPQDVRQTMTVKHDGDRVSVETKITSAQGDRVVKDEYTLDGKEAEFTPPPPPNAPPDAKPAKGKRAGRWLPNDKGFLVEEEITNETPQGPQTLTVARKWIRWPDGTMSIEIIQDTPRGTFNSKRVFVKK